MFTYYSLTFHKNTQNLDQKVNPWQNTIVFVQKNYASPENFTPALLVMLETFRRSGVVFLGLSLARRSHDQFPGLSLIHLPPSLPLRNLETWKLGSLDTAPPKQMCLDLPNNGVVIY